MLTYFLPLGNELTNQSLKSSLSRSTKDFCGGKEKKQKKYGGFSGKWEVTVKEYKNYRVSFWG